MTLKILHFNSPTCSICKNQDLILQELKHEQNIEFQSLLITTNFADALKYGVQSAPTLVYLIDDKAASVKPGFQSREKILNELKKLLGSPHA